ncbi:bifunctional cobalt-precorrin-7 (C(5))-methyltransferase/cobalt-precorrin-6B (C(15))-methyltransferase [Alicyclobacillus sp. TC]|uniref:Precorrin-6Y C5,15-methyltransferase (Decarboxylating) n=2 Tax=Alicyclobacillus tolerans TaxID=90970 RepID=A0A1M6UZH3_9BACL|nr:MULTISPECIES: bifunctional cobalt-precorrin-7 (C(5))-methyltransferase/cobalt-precorrin-6B (C(15))-methyltransferase [Alicyclobacillus]MDP9727097.1 precorrin-6Y C5,15-methyltransferase (decarboxylating) [Alicyclobacillus tengchongensis]QRF22871.1 bifunctional cobalt-precorrin-7 (C(5))-methyltransferase/cobalt-precorrin-6B (C(15))-methyltransferase [Alicyclobacillus sp. TC]SHK74590.1 precorrin-6Y C5,15-methyltransferase (decarboxylating) [Alicyclobacillus montanus]
MKDKQILIVGIGDDGKAGLSVRTLERIAASAILYGGERQLSFFPDFPGEKRVIRSPLQDTIQEIEQSSTQQSVTVLASGDPLFYGIGATLAHKLGRERVEIIPHLSSVQLAFSRAGESWHAAKVVSLHGKSIRGLAQKLHGVPVAALLTDDVHTPSVIAEYLKKFEMNEYDAFVAEHLGSEQERTGWYSLDDLIQTDFSPLNVVLLKHRKNAKVPVFKLGMDDESFAQRKPDRGLITKREIRVLALSELALQPGGVLWDIGACTGSVSIEAILSTPHLQVYAVEKNEGDLQNLFENQVKFRTDFVAIHAKAPEGLDGFPDPDAVFLGGSGGELIELLTLCAERLRPGGRIVVNAITIENLYQAQQTLQKLGFQVSITLVQTSRSKPILNLTRLEGMNPVYLVTAWRAETEEDENHVR